MMLHAKPPESTLAYRDIFQLRGSLYHQAMEKFPDARAEEFLSVLRQAEIATGMTVVDIPSGGGYLARHLSDVKLTGLETSKAFADMAVKRMQNVLLYENNRFPLKDSHADRVLSIAGLHHIEDKRAVFSEMRRILIPGGRLIVADVAEDSPVRTFLDEFVGRYSLTGHSGWYFGDVTRSDLRDCGFTIVADKRLEYLWLAPDMKKLGEFCKLLFGMVHADPDTVAAGIREHLGVRERDSQLGMNWQLQCFVCQ